MPDEKAAEPVCVDYSLQSSIPHLGGVYKKMINSPRFHTHQTHTDAGSLLRITDAYSIVWDMAQILIVEDEPHLVELYETKLLFYGYQVFSSRDGEAGLDAALTQKPDLILLDIYLPKKDGLTMLHELRQDPWGKDVPVIILTNYDTNDERLKKVIEDQPAYYILKTDKSIDQVVQRINEVLSDKKDDKLHKKSVE